jgi:hypothetical protein
MVELMRTSSNWERIERLEDLPLLGDARAELLRLAATGKELKASKGRCSTQPKLKGCSNWERIESREAQPLLDRVLHEVDVQQLGKN